MSRWGHRSWPIGFSKPQFWLASIVSQIHPTAIIFACLIDNRRESLLLSWVLLWSNIGWFWWGGQIVWLRLQVYRICTLSIFNYFLRNFFVSNRLKNSFRVVQSATDGWLIRLPGNYIVSYRLTNFTVLDFLLFNFWIDNLRKRSGSLILRIGVQNL